MNYKDYSKQYPKIILKEVRSGNYPCFYCGIKSTSIDHFIPVSFITDIRMFIEATDTKETIYQKIMGKQKLIPCCKQCNSIANDGLFDTPDEKKSYIKAKLRKKYNKLLEMPYWSKEEKEELGYWLKQCIIEGEGIKNLTKKRLSW